MLIDMEKGLGILSNEFHLEKFVYLYLATVTGTKSVTSFVCCMLLVTSWVDLACKDSEITMAVEPYSWIGSKLWLTCIIPNHIIGDFEDRYKTR